jgi:hypothetical protein
MVHARAVSNRDDLMRCDDVSALSRSRLKGWIAILRHTHSTAMTVAAPRRLRVPLTIAVGLAVLIAACTPTEDQPDPTSAATLAALQSAVPSLSASPSPSSPPLAAGPDASRSARPSESAPAPSPTQRAPADDARKREPFSMNLFRRGDFVAQYTFEWCVGASLQMALNMTTDEKRTTKADQQRLWEMARDRSFSPFGGANPRGWTATLNDLGIGPYQLVSLPTFEEAITTAATAIRLTKRPVGLVMWRGRHAWVMSGFEATADPRHFDDFRVKRVRVHDPLYPHGSSVWGKSPRPNSLVTLDVLSEQYVIRDRGRVDLGVPPGYLLVLPLKDAA